MITKVKGLEIKIMSLKAGIPKYDLAVHLGTPANRLSEIESGRREPLPELLARILDIIGPRER